MVTISCYFGKTGINFSTGKQHFGYGIDGHEVGDMNWSVKGVSLFAQEGQSKGLAFSHYQIAVYFRVRKLGACSSMTTHESI